MHQSKYQRKESATLKSMRKKKSNVQSPAQLLFNLPKENHKKY